MGTHRVSYPKSTRAHIPNSEAADAETDRNSSAPPSSWAAYKQSRRYSRRMSSITATKPLALPSRRQDEPESRRRYSVLSNIEDEYGGQNMRYSKRKESVTTSLAPMVRIHSVSRSESLNDTFNSRRESSSDITLKGVVSSPINVAVRTARLPTLKGISGRQYPVPIYNEFHRIIFDFTESRIFSGFILFIILLNTLILIAQTWIKLAVFCSWIFSAIDYIFLGIYIMEILLKLYSWRLQFFDESWNWLDFIIVVFNSGDFLFLLIMQSNAFGGAAIFRLLRILRGIRTLRALRVLRTIRWVILYK